MAFTEINKISAYAIFLLWMILCPVIALADETYVVTSKPIPYDYQHNPLINLKYNKEDFGLAYKAFVFNNNVYDAFALSLAAVRQRPDLLLWHERLAQTATWTNNPDIALEEYVYLIVQKKEIKYLTTALKLATSLQRVQILKQLFEYEYALHPRNEVNIVNLAKVYDQLGEPALGLHLLTKEDHHQLKKIYLEEMVAIDQNLDDYHATLAVLKQIIRKYGITEKLALDAAAIEWNQKKFTQALRTLKSVSNKAYFTNTDYLNMKAQLAWLLGDNQTAHEAYHQLYVLHALNDEAYSNLIGLQTPADSRKTLQISLDYWRRTHYTEAYMIAMDTASDLHDWQSMTALVMSPKSNKALTALESNPNYWYLQALYLNKIDMGETGRDKLLRRALMTNNMEIDRFYLLFLTQELNFYKPAQDPRYLTAALNYWQKRAVTNYDWAQTYFSGLMMLDEPQTAIQLFQDGDKRLFNNLGWYERYATVLQELDFNKRAHQVRLDVWRTMQSQLHEMDLTDLDFWASFSVIAGDVAPAEITYPLSSYLAAYIPLYSSADGLLTWALLHNNYELVVYLANYYYPDGLPAWGEESLAILQNDMVKMGKLLKSMRNVLPRKDRVTAAQQLDQIPLAETMAFEGLKHSHDYQRYDQLQQVMLRLANEALVAEEFEQAGNLQGPRTLIAGKFFLDHMYSLAPHASIWRGQTNNSGDLAQRTYIELIDGITLERKTNRSTYTADISQHSALYNSVMVVLTSQYQLTSKFNLAGTLAYNNRSTLDTFMEIAGSQDTLSFVPTYNVTVRDSFAGNFEVNEYYLQNRTPLGQGEIYGANYYHKFWLDYPDYTIGLNLAYNHFRTDNTVLPGRIYAIFPSDITPAVSSFVPPSYWSTGATFMFGGEIRDNYTHAWRPYLSVSLLWDTSVGFGNSIDTGIAGMVFGRDKLKFYYTYTTNNQGTIQKNIVLGASYQVYF